MKTTRVLFALIILLILLVIYFAAGTIGKQSAHELSKPRYEEGLIEGFKREAKKLNDQGPFMADQNTRWDQAIVGPGPQLTHFYSFPDFSSSEIESSWILSEVKSNTIAGMCSSEDVIPSLKYGATYTLVYSGNDSLEIARYSVSKKNCKWN